MSIDPFSIVQGVRETLEDTVVYMLNLLASHTFLRIYFKQNENDLWGCKLFALKNKTTKEALHNS